MFYKNETLKNYPQKLDSPKWPIKMRLLYKTMREKCIFANNETHKNDPQKCDSKKLQKKID